MPKSVKLKPIEGTNLIEKQKSLLASTVGEVDSEIRENVPATLDGSQIGASQGQTLPKSRPEQKEENEIKTV